MTELRTLFRHASHYLGGRACLMILGFLSFPILTRVFSVADYGLMSLVLKVVLLLTVLGKFGLQNSVQRFYAEQAHAADRNLTRRYYSTLSIGAAATGIVAALLFATGLRVTPASFLESGVRHIFFLAAALIFLRSLQPALLGFLRAEGKTGAYNALEIGVRAATLLVACTLLLLWKRTLMVFFSSVIAVEACGVLLLVLYLRHRRLLDLRAVDWSYFREAAWFAFPLIGYELATVVLDSGDRLLVQHYMGSLALGYYSAAYNIATYVEESLMVPVNLALFPIYMKLWVEKGKKETAEFLSRGLNIFLALAVGVACLVLLVSRDVIVVLASRKFEDAYRLLPVLVIGLLIYAVHIFLNAALLIYKKTATMTRLVIVACVANLVLNMVLIPRLKLFGAALATLISYLLMVVLMARESFRLLPLTVSWRGLAGSTAAASIAFFSVRAMQFPQALLDAAIKSTFAILIYAALAIILNPVLRETIARWRRPGRKPASAELVVS